MTDDMTSAPRFLFFRPACNKNVLHSACADYSSVVAVKGPLVILDNVKVSELLCMLELLSLVVLQLPKAAEIVNITLGSGEKRAGQVLEINGKMAVVQVCSCTPPLVCSLVHRPFAGL